MDAITPREAAYAWLDLSAAQRAVWLDLQMLAEPIGYQLGGWARIDADLDLEIARQAVSLVMARHDAMRLRIDPHLPRQRLDPSVEAPMMVSDLSASPDPDAAFQAFAERAFASVLPLGDEPLFRVDLVRAGPRRWYSLWRCHHLITDATSVAISLRRWTEAYDALSGEGSPDLAPPSSFADKLEAEAALESASPRDSDLAYWRARFATLPEPIFPPSNAPARSAPPAAWSLAGDEYPDFAAACKGCGVTTQRAIFGLLALLLARTYSRRDIALGIALHRRDYATRDLVGMLAGLLPVRCAVDPEDSFAGNVQAIATVLDKDFRHQRISVDALGRALGRRPGMGGQLFDVVVSHIADDSDAAGIAIAGRSVEGGAFRGPEMMPLALYALERRRASVIEFELAFNPGHLDQATCARLADGLRRAVASFVADPYLAANDFSPLSPAERALVVSDWNATSASFPVAPLPALFAAQAARAPSLDAVSDNGRALSYAALDAASNALAADLQARGVGLETIVGVALHRSAETIVAALAILKAGGVYLPLDPAYPEPRLDFMLRDAKAALVITNEFVSPRLPLDIPQLRIDAESPLGTPRAVELTGENAAYIVYTSGSTGAPKGVAVSHASAANLAFARIAGHDPIGSGDRVLAAISVGFDVSIGQLLLPLLSGACVVIAPDLRTLSAPEFWTLIASERVTCINSVPSFLDSVLDAAPREGLSLKRLMLGGEAFSGALRRRLREALPSVEVVNMYGPTEACIDATAHSVPAGTDATIPVLPIGKPLANYRAYVLDERLRPVPPGVAGGLFLGGAGLARGYVGQPGLTASRFIADPFGEAPGGRLYDTGDRAMWRADGALAFLGRDDGQVKIRGFRVEPGEIEAALRTHPRVAQAAVVARNDFSPSGARLIAYVVGDDAPDATELRAYLGERLPAHMVPAVFVALKTLPLTTNGKLDRKALPAPEAEGDIAAAYVEPATPLESHVAEMFADLLGVARVGSTDDFFALGGHSLLATRLISRIRAECGVDVPLRAAFAAPTVAGLARVIAERTAAPALPAIPTGERPATLPLSFAQERLWFLDQFDPGNQIYVMPAVLRLTGTLDADALAAALQRIVDRHESLRTRFEAREGVAAQVVAPHLAIAPDSHDLSAMDAEMQGRAVRDHAAAAEREPFALADGPLIRARLLHLSRDAHVLVLAVHHIVSDGWSMGVLLHEFSTLYAAFVKGRPDPLPPLPIQYADFALWQRGWLTGEELGRQTQYWRDALAGAPDQTDLPLDRPRPPTPSLRGAFVAWRCPPALAAKLRIRAREADATPFMLLLTAFQALLSRWSGVRDVVVGTPIAQRTRAETEDLIGFFVNTLALRADFSGRPSFAQLLARGRETLLSAYAHQDLPFEKLVDAIKPERDLGRQPIVQTMFVLQNMPMNSADLPGLRMEPMDVPVSVAKFDLTLNVAEGSENDGFSGGFEYATDLFDAATIERLGGWFTRLLEAVADNPSIRINDFSPLSPAERALVVSDWNATSASFPVAPLPALFAAQAARAPSLDAVSDNGRALSYAALDAASNALAADLQARGVGLETIVGVALHRSAETIVAALAILKAGGVYLPLDPAYPEPRLDFMLRDAKAALVITNEFVSPRLPLDIPQLRIDAESPWEHRAPSN